MFYVVGSEKLDSLVGNYIKKFRPSFLQKLFFSAELKNNNFSYYSTYFLINIKKFITDIYNFKPDVFVIRNSAPLVAILLTIIISLFFKKKIILYTQTPVFKSKISFKRKFLKFLVFRIFDSWYSPVLFNSTFDKKFLKEDYGIKYIPFCMPPKKDLNLNPNSIIRFLTISKFEERKNLMLILKCFNDISRLGYKFHYTIIGQTGNAKREKYCDKLDEYIRENELKNISLIKNLSFDLLDNYYRKNDIFILNSVNETASISQLEAMSYGLPVIIGSDNGTASYVKDNGFVIDSHNIKILNDKIIYFLENKSEIKMMGKIGINLCNDYHGSKIILEKFNEIF